MPKGRPRNPQYASARISIRRARLAKKSAGLNASAPPRRISLTGVRNRSSILRSAPSLATATSRQQSSPVASPDPIEIARHFPPPQVTAASPAGTAPAPSQALAPLPPEGPQQSTVTAGTPAQPASDRTSAPRQPHIASCRNLENRAQTGAVRTRCLCQYRRRRRAEHLHVNAAGRVCILLTPAARKRTTNIVRLRPQYPAQQAPSRQATCRSPPPQGLLSSVMASVLRLPAINSAQFRIPRTIPPPALPKPLPMPGFNSIAKLPPTQDIPTKDLPPLDSSLHNRAPVQKSQKASTLSQPANALMVGPTATGSAMPYGRPLSHQ